MIQLPLAFDTGATPRLVVQGGLALAALLATAVLVTLLRHNVAAAIVLVASALITLCFVSLVVRTLPAARGTITDREVRVEPTMVWGWRLTGPTGGFPIASFRAVRYEQVAADPNIFAGSGRVLLVGGTVADLLIARTGDEGRALAHALADALKLRYEERFTGD